MERPSPTGRDHEESPLSARLFILAFGLFVLAFLEARGKPQWFVLRPASEAATAMGMAGESPENPDEAARISVRPAAEEGA